MGTTAVLPVMLAVRRKAVRGRRRRKRVRRTKTGR
jgi:hypothetical protein